MKLKILFFPMALLVAFVITIFFTKPEWDIYKDKQAEADLLTKQLDDLKSGHNSILNATKKLNELTSDQENLILNAIPRDYNNDDFLAEIHKSAERSGVFILATKLKNNELIKNSTVEITEAGQAKPVLNISGAKVTVMGSYTDVLEFVKEVDSHNRLTSPKELSIVSQDINVLVPSEGGEAVTADGMLIKCDVTFDFFSKPENEKLEIARLIRGNDPVVKSLLNGQFKTGVIENYKEDITSEVFRPVGAGNAGKADIFAK